MQDTAGSLYRYLMIETLQSLRFIFFLMIFMSHFSYGGVRAFDAGGDCGVSFFFMLSGFVLSLAYADRIGSPSFRWRDFMCRRMLKLYPLHLLCLAAAVIIGFRPHSAADCLWLVPNILLVQSWIPFSDFFFSGNAVSWFLSDILFCYAVFPVACRFVCGASRRMLIVTGTMLSALYCVLLCVIPDALVVPLLYVCPLLRFVDFALGMLLWRIVCGGVVLRFLSSRSVATVTAIELVAAAILVSVLAAYPYVPFRLRTACFFWLPSALVILTFACSGSHGMLSRLFRLPVLVRLGNSVFPLFMVHTLAIGVVMAVAERVGGSSSLSWQAMLCLSFALTMMGAKVVEVLAAGITNRFVMTGNGN